jgi:hypothetical protein
VDDQEKQTIEISSSALHRVDPKRGWRSLCGKCHVWFAGTSYQYTLERTGVRSQSIVFHRCPHCEEWNIARYDSVQANGKTRAQYARLWPPEKGTQLSIASDVPTSYAADLNESYAVLDVSAKASAALSRRLLQRMLHDRGIKKRSLDAEIDELLKRKILQSDVAADVDAIRTVGNFAAHPI